MEQSALLSVSSVWYYIFSVDPSKISIYYSGGVTLKFLLMKRRDEIVSNDNLAIQADIYIPSREKSLSFSAWEGGIEKLLWQDGTALGAESGALCNR